MANQTHRNVNRVSYTYWTINLGPDKAGNSVSCINGWLFVWENGVLYSANSGAGIQARLR
jgi:hypothetical protein